MPERIALALCASIVMSVNHPHRASAADLREVAFDSDHPSGEEHNNIDRPRPMLRRYADRPLTEPRDTFTVWGGLGASKLTETQGAASLEAGALYGISSDLEIEILLLRLQ